MKKTLFADSGVGISLFAKKITNKKSLRLSFNLKVLFKKIENFLIISIEKIFSDKVLKIFSYLILIFFFLQVLRINDSWGTKIFFTLILIGLGYLLESFVFEKKEKK